MQNVLFAVVVCAALGWVAYATRRKWLPNAAKGGTTQAGGTSVQKLWRRADLLRREININDPEHLKRAMANPPADIEGRYALLCMVYRESCEFLKMAKEYGWTDAGVQYKMDALSAAMAQLSDFFLKDQAGQLKPSRSMQSADWFRAMAGETISAFEASRFIFERARSARSQAAKSS